MSQSLVMNINRVRVLGSGPHTFTQFFLDYRPLPPPGNDSSDGEESQYESNDAESDSESDQEGIIQKKSSKPCHHCQNWNMSVTAVVKCPRCFGRDNYSICPICGYGHSG